MSRKVLIQAQAVLSAAIRAINRALRPVVDGGPPAQEPSCAAEVAAIAGALHALQLDTGPRVRIGGNDLGQDLAAGRSIWQTIGRDEGWGRGRTHA